MIHINIDDIILPTGWQEKSNNAIVDVENGTKINDRSTVWSSLKDPLADLSNDKCWYCESKQIRSDDAVDHYRPKNRVSNTTPLHNGYTWLAFDYKNYRYSCTFCNSKRKNPETGETEGKGDEFPLLDETKRARTSTDNINLEKPVLLDPCKVNDVKLLDFFVTGEPKSKYSDQIKKDRCEKSIKLYHLDHPSLIEKRKLIALKIKEKVDEIKQFIEENPGLEPSESLQKDLQSFIKRESEYSAFARRVIMGYRDLEWIEDLICTA